MDPLFLSGFGVTLNVDRTSLLIKDGHIDPNVEPNTYEIRPRHVPFDSIVIDSQSGQISITAMKWLMRHGIPLFILDYNGTLLSSTLPREPVVGKLKKAQIEAYQDPQKRFYIAKKIVEAKLERTRQMAEWLSVRYDVNRLQRRLDAEISRFEQAKTLRDLLFVEGRTAEAYWRVFQSIIPEKYGFVSRMSEKHQMNSTDPVNTLLNYGYAFLESRCRAAINSVGLEPSIGFLHEIVQPTYPLVYDLQESYRWLVDSTVLSCTENEMFGKTDFFLTDNYVLRLETSAIKKLLGELRSSFNSKVRYKGKNWTWDTILRLKMQELSRYLLHKDNEFDFRNPQSDFDTSDSRVIREKILSMSQSNARKIGIGKSSLWYVKNRIGSNRKLRIYSKTKERMLLLDC